MNRTTDEPQKSVAGEATAQTGGGAPWRAPTGSAGADLLCSPKTLGLPARERRDYWQESTEDHLNLYVVREFIREHSDMTGQNRLFGSCLRYFHRYYQEGSREEKFCPNCCGARAVCPHCAVNYGLERGLEVSSLFRALFEPGKLLPKAPTVKVFADVFTLPSEVSTLLDSYCEARDKKALTKALRELTAALRNTLQTAYGSGVAAKVIWHWWHSSQPLTGPHWHAHVMVPNISSEDGLNRVLRSRGALSLAELDNLKTVWAEQVAGCRFLADFNLPEQLTVNHRFLTRNRGKNSIAHRARYDYRHPMQDFMHYQQKNGLPELGDRSFEWFLQRCEFLQSVQTVRSIGWLTNSKIKQVGLQKSEPEPDKWIRDDVRVYEVVSFDEQGVLFKVFNCVTQQDEGVKHIHRCYVKLLGRPKPRFYRWVT